MSDETLKVVPFKNKEKGGEKAPPLSLKIFLVNGTCIELVCDYFGQSEVLENLLVFGMEEDDFPKILLPFSSILFIEDASNGKSILYK